MAGDYIREAALSEVIKHQLAVRTKPISLGRADKVGLAADRQLLTHGRRRPCQAGATVDMALFPLGKFFSIAFDFRIGLCSTYFLPE